MSAIKPRSPDFSGAFLKLQRAKAHIADLDAAAAKFFNGNPYLCWPEIDPVSKRHGYVIGNRRPLPADFALIIGDAVHNLRSSLDLLITACAAANGGDPTRSYFPIVRDFGKLEDAIRKKVTGPGAGETAASLVRQAKPHKRGNGPLFAIQCLDIADKHQIVIATKTVLHVSVRLEGNDVTLDRSFRTASGVRRFIPVPAGMEDQLIPAEISFTSEIVFGAKGPRAGEPCIGELQSFTKATESVLTLFRSNFR